MASEAFPFDCCDILEQFRDCLKQHQENPDTHGDFNWPHYWSPGRWTAFVIFKRVCGTIECAIQQNAKVEYQNKYGERVHPRFLICGPVTVEQVHANIGPQLQGIRPPHDIIGNHGELGYLKGPY